MHVHLPRLFSSLSAAPAPPLAEGSVKLAGLLKIPVNELSSVRMGHQYHYRPFAVPKKNGDERRILAPSPALKELQERLLRRYLAHLPVHPAAMAFMPGASIVRNAQRHAGQAVIVTADLTDFFPSTSAERVRAFFVREGWRGEALGALMRLCVYQNGLPQGAPTSPCLSNLVNAGLDGALDELARRAGARYTRYGDDLTFSWAERAEFEASSWFRPAVERELLTAGYRIQGQKGWRVSRIAERPQIAGVTLKANGQITPSKRVRAQIKSLRIRAWWQRLTGRDAASTRARLRGYQGFMHMFE